MNRHYEQCVELGELLKAEGATVTTVESLTGGGIAHAITEVPGSSAWMKVAYVTYSNEHKTELVGVPEELLAEQGPVCKNVAMAMAMGGLNRANATYAIAVTGIAGPDGGSDDKPVGTVWIAVSTPWRVLSFKKQYDPSLSRSMIRELTIQDALDELIQLLSKKQAQ